MGVMTRKQSDVYVITSDRTAGDQPSKIVPKRRPADAYQVWTGDKWSATASEARTFKTENEADAYLEANCKRILELG